MSIPSNYIEDLKIQCGSAVADLAIDDMIVFQTTKHRPVKNILRKNLAIVIEARLKEIAEWIRNEIKDAGCGSKFAPTLLLTGGGSQMRDIEKLFARELDIAEARTVHPEYGFTEETMLEHITSPADATVASLLVYGAQRGSCTISLRPEHQLQREATTPRPTDLWQYDNITPRTEAAAPVQTQQTQQTQVNPVYDNPVKQKPSYLEDEGEDIPSAPRSSWGKKIRDIFNKAGNTFIGDGEEGEF